MTQVRHVRPEELRAVGHLTATVYRSEGFGSEESQPVLRDAEARAATGTVLVAVGHGDALLGAVTVVTGPGPGTALAGPGEAEVDLLVTDPAARGRGVGEALARACLDLARDAGSCSVVLSSEPTMHAAHRLWGRLGFVRVPSRDWSPARGQQLFAFVLPLVSWCDACGLESTHEGHERCRAAGALEPPRYCAHCRRRMVVQVTPTAWTARCVEHGERRSTCS